jgi:tetratricopeptide (TPR) repeat protein
VKFEIVIPTGAKRSGGICRVPHICPGLADVGRSAKRTRFSAFGFSVLCVLSSALCAAQTSLPPGTSNPDEPRQQQSIPDPLTEAESAIADQHFPAAANRLDVYLSAHPDSARALFDRGYVADAQKQTANAESWYRKAIAADPKQFESRLALGLILAAKNDPGAREQLDAAVQLEPNPPNPVAKAQADRALARLIRSSDPTGARDALVAALQLTPETPDDTLLAAEIAAAAGNEDLAEQAYRRVLDANPNSSEASAGLAHLYMGEKKYAEAQPLVEAALRRDPDDPALNAQLAAILSAQGKQADALTLLEKLHQLQPHSASVTGMLADAEFQAGNLDKADALFQQLLAAEPSDASLLDARGQILIRQQHYDDALASFHKAAAARPDDIDAWSGIAFADSELHLYADELQALSTRSKFAPDNPTCLFLRATAYDNLHQTQAAADYYHRFLTAAQGKFPDQEWQAKHRLTALGK